MTITGITNVAINGLILDVGGYWDIGLFVTRKDLFVNFIGAVVFSVTGFFYARSKGKKKTGTQSFVPSPKTANQDFLKQVWGQNWTHTPKDSGNASNSNFKTQT